MDAERGRSIGQEIQTGRLDRSHPPLGSGVLMAELTGIQRVEAKAVDLASSQLVQIFKGPSRARDLDKVRKVTDSVTSLAHLEAVVRESFGSDVVRRLKRAVQRELVNFGEVDPSGCQFAVHESLAHWAARTAPENQPVQNLIAASSNSRLEVRLRANGLSWGPGSYRERGQTRKEKRHNGRGRAGKNFPS